MTQQAQKAQKAKSEELVAEFEELIAEITMDSAKLEELIAGFAKDSEIQKLVTQIEAKPETTQHHYGDYGAALSYISGGSKFVAFVIKEAMKRCGGNCVGIDNGFNLFM